MVTIAMKQNIDLVDQEYYKKELAYQDRIDKITNTVEKKAISLKFDEDSPFIVLDFEGVVNEGEIHLFRPKDASEDLQISISTDENGVQMIPYETLSSGLWRIKIDWTHSGEEFYFEQQIQIP